MQQKAETECPDNGWNRSDTETCRQAIYDAAAEKMAGYEAKNADLKEKLAAIDPDTCTVYGGDALELDKP